MPENTNKPRDIFEAMKYEIDELKKRVKTLESRTKTRAPDFELQANIGQSVQGQLAIHRGPSGRWAKFDCSSVDSYLWNGNYLAADAWLQADIYIPDTTLAVITPELYTAHLLSLVDIDWTDGDRRSTSGLDLTALAKKSGAIRNWRGTTFASELPLIATQEAAENTVYTIKMHQQDYPGGTFEVFINDVLIASIPSDTLSPDEGFALGGVISNRTHREVYYATNVMAGTTEGAHDLFFDNFSSGNFSLWYEVTGNCSIVSLGGFRYFSDGIWHTVVDEG